MTLESRNKNGNKKIEEDKNSKKLNKDIAIYLFSKKGSAKEKVFENKINDFFDKKSKEKAKVKILKQGINPDLIKDKITKFNRYDPEKGNWPTLNQVKGKIKEEKEQIVKDRLEKIDKVFERRKQNRIKKAAELTVKELNEKINSKKSLDIKNNSKQLKLNTKKVA